MLLGESHVVNPASVTVGVGPTLGLVASLSIIIVLVYVMRCVPVLIVWTSLLNFTVSIRICTYILIVYTLSDTLYVALQLQGHCLAPHHSCHNAEGRLFTVQSSNSIWLGAGKVLKVHPGAMCMWIWSFDSFSNVVYLLFLFWYVRCFQLSVQPILVCCALNCLTYDSCVLFIYDHRGSY